MMHKFWAVSNRMTCRIQYAMFMKNPSLLLAGARG